jgi:hypothetical protein
MITSRQEAKTAGATRYFTGKPCVRGHIVERHVTNSTCVACMAVRVAAWDAANPGRKSQRTVASQKRNPDRTKELRKATYDRTKSVRNAESREWYANNKDAARALNRRWVENNRASTQARQAARLATKKNATPKWLTAEQKAEIRSVYERCVAVSLETGIPHHVDHIIPIRGETVTGLHVPWNLRVIPASENVRKKNKLLVEYASL